MQLFSDTFFIIVFYSVDFIRIAYDFGHFKNFFLDVLISLSHDHKRNINETQIAFIGCDYTDGGCVSNIQICGHL